MFSRSALLPAAIFMVAFGHFSKPAEANMFDFNFESITLQNFESVIPANPFDHPAGIISHDPNDIRFYFYSNPTDVDATKELVFNDTKSIEDSGFKQLQPTVFIVHGFRSNVTSEMPQTLKNAFLKTMELENFGISYNIIVVDWGLLATPLPPTLTPLLYNLARLNVPVAAERLADFINYLTEENILRIEHVYLVGHSLGAHLSGLAGRQVYLTSGRKIPRITGLDPAGPGYFPPIPTRNLMKEDAEFVDVIHTNAGMLGDLTNDGHVDFYPNGGSSQPDCYEADNSSPTTIGRCSHRYSYKLFAESITRTFSGCPCKDIRLAYPLGLCSATCESNVTVTMGFHCPHAASGEYYLITTTPPAPLINLEITD